MIILKELKKIFSIPKIIVVDAGADIFNDQRQAWIAIGKENLILRVFDGDSLTCDEKNIEAEELGLDHKYICSAIGENKSEIILNVCQTPPCSSIFKLQNNTEAYCYDGNTSFSDHHKILNQIKIPQISLDEYLINNLPNSKVDFLKMNIEGSELNCLKGFREGIIDTLGIEVEVSFIDLREGEPSFADIDQFLRGENFQFFDLLAPNQLGYKNSYFYLPATRKLATHSWPRKQLFQGHALYLRNPLANCDVEKEFNKDPIKYIKSAIISDAYGQIEFAFALLEKFSSLQLSEEIKNHISQILKKVSVAYGTQINKSINNE